MWAKTSRTALLAAALAIGGCGSTTTTAVTQTVTSAAPTSAKAVAKAPNEIGKRLDVAESDLEESHLPYQVIGGGTFGVVVPSHWTVCETEPKAGAHTSKKIKLI